MKKIVFIFLFVFSSIVFFYAYRTTQVKLTSFASANIEALSNGEGYVLACANQPDIMCYIKCGKCGAVWSAKYSSGPRIAYIGDCNCGKK